MNEFQGLIKFMQSPLGNMLLNAGKDVFSNHLLPYLRNSAMQQQPMSPEEQQRRAKDEFADVSDEFDIPGQSSPTDDPK